jgi:lauroyl/myristoyl acyltransferase
MVDSVLRLGCIFGKVGLSRFFQWRINTLLIGWLPLRIGRVYLGLLGKLYYLVNSKEKREIRRNLSLVRREVTAREYSEAVLRRTFQGIFAHYHEKLFTGYSNYSRLCRFLRNSVELENQHVLDEALSQGRGVILVTGHFGGVEFLPSTLALCGYPVTMVVRFKTARLKRTLNQRARRVGITLLDAGEGETVIFRVLQALHSKQILITECDEFKAWRPERGRRTTFLGYSTPVDRTLDLIQRRSRAPAIMGLVFREDLRRYALRLCSLDSVSQGCEAWTVGERALNVLERSICLAPDQWYQWKDLSIITGIRPLEQTRPIHALETDRALPVAHPALHAHQA